MKLNKHLLIRPLRRLFSLPLLRSCILFFVMLMSLNSVPLTAQGQSPVDQETILTYTIDRSAVPQLTYNALTLKIYIGKAQSVSASADGQPAQVLYNPQTGYALVTTTGTNLRVTVRNATLSSQFGAYTKTVLRDNKKWAWSHGFDDNVDFKQYGIPAFETYGWRATIYLIGNAIGMAQNESWILDTLDIVALVNKGWGIGNHTWSHNTVKAQGGANAATADIIRMDDFLHDLLKKAGRSDYRLMSFAAPMFDTDYLPIILSLRNSRTTALLFDDSGNNFFIRLDTGGTEPAYGRFGLFNYNGEIGRDYRINSYALGDESDTSFRADLASMVSQLDDNHHYWLNTFSHGVDSQYPGKGIFAFLPWLYKTYGPGGDNSVWVAPAEEIYSYKLVYDNVKIAAHAPTSFGYTDFMWLPLLTR